MAESNFRPQPRPRNALDYDKFKLKAPVPGHEGKFATLVWEFVGQNPRIKVWTNDPNDEGNDYGRIFAKMDGQNCMALIEMIRDAIAFLPTDANPEWESISVENMGGWKNGKPETLESETKIGRDKNGIWIALLDKKRQNRPRIRFYFGHHNDYHRYIKADGKPMGKEEASVYFARGYLNLLQGLIINLTAVANFEKKEQQQGQGNRQGGYNRNNNGGGNRNYGGGGGASGGTQSEEVAGDDIPW